MSLGDMLEGAALRLHRVHCGGCSECRHALPAVAARTTTATCPHLAGDPDDCWECFDAQLPGPAGLADMEARDAD